MASLSHRPCPRASHGGISPSLNFAGFWRTYRTFSRIALHPDRFRIVLLSDRSWILLRSPLVDPATSSPDDMIPSASGLFEFNLACNQEALIAPRMARGQAATPSTGIPACFFHPWHSATADRFSAPCSPPPPRHPALGYLREFSISNRLPSCQRIPPSPRDSLPPNAHNLPRSE